MIKTKKGNTKVKGDLNEILADISVLSMSMYDRLNEFCGDEHAKMLIRLCVERGFAGRMSDEYYAQCMTRITELLENIVKELKQEKEYE